MESVPSINEAMNMGHHQLRLWSEFFPSNPDKKVAFPSFRKYL